MTVIHNHTRHPERSEGSGYNGAPWQTILRPCLRITGLVVLFGLLSLPAQAQEAGETAKKPVVEDPRQDYFFSLTWENDVINQTDQSYTNGVRASMLFPEGQLPYWVNAGVEAVPFFLKGATKRIGVAVGQSMFTPDDITRRDLIVEDRPYAGWLYGTLSISADNEDRYDQLALSLGIVGPSSLAKQTQEEVHNHLPDAADPAGWSNQLHDEPAVQLLYNRTWKGQFELEESGFSMDFSPHVGLALGNVFTHAAAGGMARIGFDLPQDYGPPRITPSQVGTDFFIPRETFGWYLFGGFEVRGVAHNIFLDGNTWRDSHSVDKKYFVADATAGAALVYKDARFSYTHTWRTKEYEGQETGDVYGSFNLSIRF